MAVSLLNLLMPISEFGKYILISKTNRAPESVGGEFYTELTLFVITLIGWNDMVVRFSNPTFAPDNEFINKMQPSEDVVGCSPSGGDDDDVEGKAT